MASFVNIVGFVMDSDCGFSEGWEQASNSAVDKKTPTRSVWGILIIISRLASFEQS